MTNHRLCLARLILVFAIGSPIAVSSRPASAPAGPGTDASPVVVAFGIDPAALVKRIGAAGIAVEPLMGTADSCACSGVPVSAGDREVARRMVDYWSAFAAGGVPHDAGQPDWPRDTRSTSETMAFGSSAEVRTDFMKARLNAFTVMLNVLDRLAPAR